MRFTKVHGAGNDFILLDARETPGTDFSSMAPRLCARQTGIGADGLLVLLPSESCDARMRIINADGSEAEMCGNGIRAFARYMYDRGIARRTELTVETIAGVMRPRLILDGEGNASTVRVDMGMPALDAEDVPVLGGGRCIARALLAHGRTFSYSSVRVGVPVTGVPVDDPTSFDICRFGPAIECHTLFPERTNVAFYRVMDRQNVEMRIWERGAGPTLACGTGACATAVITALTGETEKNVNIHLALATLHIEWAQDGRVYMTGPAELVFDGEIEV